MRITSLPSCKSLRFYHVLRPFFPEHKDVVWVSGLRAGAGFAGVFVRFRVSTSNGLRSGGTPHNQRQVVHRFWRKQRWSPIWWNYIWQKRGRNEKCQHGVVLTQLHACKPESLYKWTYQRSSTLTLRKYRCTKSETNLGSSFALWKLEIAGRLFIMNRWLIWLKVGLGYIQHSFDSGMLCFQASWR